MKRIFSIHNNSNATDIALLIARAGIALLMLTHGIPKLMMLFSEAPVQFPSLMGMSSQLSLGLIVFAEVICSGFLFAGFGTRLATLPLIITMLAAIIFVHGADPIAVKEPALQYLLVYLVLLFAGSGKYSIDYLLQSSRAADSYQSSKVKDATLAMYE